MQGGESEVELRYTLPIAFVPARVVRGKLQNLSIYPGQIEFHLLYTLRQRTQ